MRSQAGEVLSLQKVSENQALEHTEEEELVFKDLIGMRKKGYEVPLWIIVVETHTGRGRGV